MHVVFVDRQGAHSIWQLMNFIARGVLNEGGKVSYYRWNDDAQREPLPAPPGVSVRNITVGGKRYPWDVVRQQQTFCRKIRKHLLADGPDVIHTNFCLPGSTMRRFVKRHFNLPVVTTCHELFGSMNAYLRHGVRRTERFADRIVYISQTVANSYGASLNKEVCSAGQTERIIYNGVDTESIRSTAQSAGSRSPNVLVSVGRLVSEKGHSQVIRALPALIAEFPTLQYQLVGEGPERVKLCQLAKSLGIEHRVEFTGWLTHQQAIAHMARASAVVMPSRPVQEGFGLALVEAMCCVPRVVASDIPVFAEVVDRDLSSVSFFRTDDIADLTAHLRSALISSLNASSDIDEGYELVRNKYCSQKMVCDYMDVYSEVAKKADL